jgi:hypothetical protein
MTLLRERKPPAIAGAADIVPPEGHPESDQTLLMLAPEASE